MEENPQIDILKEETLMDKKTRLINDCVALFLNGAWMGALATALVLGVVNITLLANWIWMMTMSAAMGFFMVWSIADLVELEKEVKAEENRLREILDI
jgi:hypothetical protein